MSGLLSPLGWGIVLPILTSMAYACTLVCMRQAMRSGTPLAGVLTLNPIVALVGFTVAFFRGSLQTTTWEAPLYFMAAGVVGQGMGQLSFYMGIERMGVSRATPIQSSTPIWAVLFAALFLSERPTLAVWAGTVLIVLGISLLSLAEVRERGRPGGGGRGALLYPILSSLLYALVPIFMKQGFALQKTPFLGIGCAFLTGTFVVLAGRPLVPGGGKIQADGRAMRIFLVASVTNTLAAAFFWTALTIADVSLVLPLSRLVPLWVVVLSYFFLGHLERLTWRVALSAALVVAGGVLVSAFR
jgi:drug/metabolite transporter (DMT)-like permease